MVDKLNGSGAGQKRTIRDIRLAESIQLAFLLLLVISVLILCLWD